mgnify:CR=1 FL=1
MPRQQRQQSQSPNYGARPVRWLLMQKQKWSDNNDYFDDFGEQQQKCQNARQCEVTIKAYSANYYEMRSRWVMCQDFDDCEGLSTVCEKSERVKYSMEGHVWKYSMGKSELFITYVDINSCCIQKCLGHAQIHLQYGKFYMSCHMQLYVWHAVFDTLYI